MVQTPAGNSDRPDAANSGGTTNENDAGCRRGEIILLVAVLFLALALRLWGLDHNRWGAEYYTAAVRSMAMNWHNFFYAAFDPTGFISLDKPPVAFWLQVLSVKLFGFHPLSVLLPQVLMGVGSVWLLHHLVRRRFSALAALLAALFLAVTPIWVAVNRTNNTDTCLLLVLLLAAWALMKAADEGSRRLLMLSMALVGLAFNVKMLAAYIVLPTFCLVYLIGAPRRWPRKFADLTLAILILVICSLPWVLAYEVTPKESRPFVGGSHNNSMLELVVGHNAMSRFFSPLKSPAVNERGLQAQQAAAGEVKPVYGTGSDAEAALRVLFSRVFMSGTAGPLRLADGQPAAQTLWLFPFAVMAIFIGLGQSRVQRPLPARHLAVLFWCCWLSTYVAVYSYLGGIIHFYYLSTLSPALAALAGIGIADLWSWYHRKNGYAFLLPALLLLTAAWQLTIQAGALGWSLSQPTSLTINWVNGLHIALLGGTLLAVAGLLLIYFLAAVNRVTSALARSSLAIGIAALLILPCTWAVSSILIPGNGLLPSADLYRLIAVTGDQGPRIRRSVEQPRSTAKLIKFLQANRKDERYLLATSTTELAAPIIIRTGEAVLARGGFHGIVPAVTPESLARMVETGALRFVMLGDVSTVNQKMNSDTNKIRVADWVRAHGKLVDPSLWQSYRMARRGMDLYDLRPAE
jgi:4-amino-4-deoxy-L-arabinose transferase-like glycosyltransferase